MNDMQRWFDFTKNSQWIESIGKKFTRKQAA